MATLKSIRSVTLSTSHTIHDWLLISSAFSCILLAVRIAATGSLSYIFMPWNLFLAIVPYGITWWMSTNVSVIENKYKLIPALAVWLLFIPNAFYIITDLFHLVEIQSAPKWFDLLLVFSFAWNGILCGIISLRRVEIVITLLRGKGFSLLIVFMVMWLNAFGIYIGRFLRYNSWDIISDPFDLAREIIHMIFHPFQNLSVWVMVSGYAVFMTLLYFTIKKMSESFAIRN